MSNLVLVLPPTFEHHYSGIGISTNAPRISWRFRSTSADVGTWNQKSVEIQAFKGHGIPVSVYHYDSPKSVLVPWPFEPLESRQIVQVRVRAIGGRDDQYHQTEWSPWSTVEAGLLERDCWEAQMITSLNVEKSNGMAVRPIRVRRLFNLPNDSGAIVKARIYSTAFGVYQAHLNGSIVGDHIMSPGWTSYHHRICYQVFDVTNLLRPGRSNVLGFEVAEGWYAGRIGWGTKATYGTTIGIFAQLEVKFESGTKFILATNQGWESCPSPLIRSQIYDGETYSAMEDDLGWSSPDGLSAIDSEWTAVRMLEEPRTTFISSDAPPIRITEKIAPTRIISSPTGKTILDFGQNLVGKLHIKSLNGPAGHRLKFTHAEVLENEELGTRPLRSAMCLDEIVTSGQCIKDWTPKFTFHGFRYVQIEGWTAEAGVSPPLDLNAITALVTHSDMERTGTFECSHPLVNKLHQNIVWSMRGNFFSIPTDCPQRDERLGWTGDIQVFAPTANFLYNTTGFLSSWLQDLAVEQKGRGGVPPLVVPNVLDSVYPVVPQAIWGDAAVLTPWDVYTASGDLEILRNQYESMMLWVDSGIRRNSDGLWVDDLWQLGDWLDPKAPPNEPGDARTSAVMVSDAYLVHVTFKIAEIATLVGNHRDSTSYYATAEHLKKAFHHKYVAPSGFLVSDTQTALSLAIVFHLYDSPLQLEAAGNRLEHLVRISKFRVATGFVGTSIILHALTLVGREQVAYRMLQEKRLPSWLYPVTMGATTVWERWDSLLPDGSINPGEMTSFNHYALGSVADWLHTVVGGIRPKEAGWKSFFVAPRPGGTIRNAKVTYESPYGRIECSWFLKEAGEARRFELNVLVPPNSEAWVMLPDTVREESDKHVIVGSGSHTFFCDLSAKDWPLTAIKTYLWENAREAGYKPTGSLTINQYKQRYGRHIPALIH
ncbi:glycoside hydrolase family 78 protein [Aaosphaeria arxii CBS 175.79]|uniref:alpha-L-rhamnosidase n=1 Tax=Aaosphaeria arxii CBS 175.79 TaxID=1450172 RepID=A0A6A5XIP3_9PLEO|nr:glycoside hydrolase family 78 protein [Aaosphaeria arxii CBS 175.79]KAF2012729.1 glycoside hydrolase family 78 protein [Aaosphaeria arxii CBS 175.79]